MPKGYEKMRDKFAKNMSYDAAQAKAARIWNAAHPGNPVGRYSHRKRKMPKHDGKGFY